MVRYRQRQLIWLLQLSQKFLSPYKLYLQCYHLFWVQSKFASFGCGCMSLCTMISGGREEERKEIEGGVGGKISDLLPRQLGPAITVHEWIMEGGHDVQTWQKFTLPSLTFTLLVNILPYCQHKILPYWHKIAPYQHRFHPIHWHKFCTDSTTSIITCTCM